MAKPKIALMLDDDAEKGGKTYLLPKHYFEAIHDAGGIPYGIPYEEDFIELASQEFDGLFSTGGRCRPAAGMVYRRTGTALATLPADTY